MNANVLSMTIPAISAGRISAEEFQSHSGIAGRTVADSVIEFLLSQGIGRADGKTIEFAATDRLRTAMLCMRLGIDAEQVSGHLHWHDFEMLASEALRAFGYRVQTNVRFTKPRMEIDVIGIDGDFSLSIDCKHWKKSSRSSLLPHAKKQVRRASEFARRNNVHSVPVLLTLHAGNVRFIDRVPVVPVNQFGSFVTEIKGFLGEIAVVSPSS